MAGGQHAAPITDLEEVVLWKQILSHAGQTFTTSGRSSRPGKSFTYSIQGAEMFVSNKAKSITRSTISTGLPESEGIRSCETDNRSKDDRCSW